MKLQIDVRVSVGITDFDKLVHILHTDYLHNRRLGYKGTPYDYVKSAVLTFPNIQKLFTYENVCTLIAKKCAVDGTTIVNGVGEITHYFNIILAINTIIINGITLKYKVGDILICDKSNKVLIVDKVDTEHMVYVTSKLNGTFDTAYDTEFIEECFRKIGVFAKE